MDGKLRFIGLMATLGVLAGAPGARADGDAANFARLGFDDLPSYCLFQETVALRDQYSDRGLSFRGSAPLDGGGVLSNCAFFLVVGFSPPNFVGFNAIAEYSDGGIPVDPQTILFAEPVNFVQVNVGAFIEVDYPATLRAYDSAGENLTSSTVLLARETKPLRVEAPGIARVVLSAPGARYIFDDLLWGKSPGAELILEPRALTVNLAAGSTTSANIILSNAAACDLEFFVQERPEPPAGARREPRPATLEALGEPVSMANLKEPRDVPPARYLTSDAGARDLSLLVYTEIDPNGTNYDTDLDQALRSLDIAYTGVYGAMGIFRETLASQDWDMVIFDHQLAYLYLPDLAVYDELLGHVNRGGRLILGSWQIADVPTHPLWEALGIEWLEDYTSPESVRWTEAAAAFATVPNDVPDLKSLGDYYLIDGHHIAAQDSATVIATLGPDSNPDLQYPGLVLSNEGRSLYRAFMDGASTLDLDEDGIRDVIELWRNLLVQMMAEDVPWLSTDAEGLVPAGTERILTVDCDATDLAPGTYPASLELRTNEAVHDTYNVEITLVVTAAADTPAEPRLTTPLRAYPNPFNPTITLDLELATADVVTLQILDPAGRLVRTLAQTSPLGPGNWAFRWDGRDRQGQNVAASVYLVRLITSRETTTQPIVLVR